MLHKFNDYNFQYEIGITLTSAKEKHIGSNKLLNHEL